ncbi:UDP-N-acetyl-D-galactosamine dehydrogenase [Pacificimonas flava]|uniref:UDP-N-acetyl-D-galactosamine dehydrogenase n=2 Tax=Pacificimonas TaxID=1960290 RepID=A0A219B8G2_9SPHN|nr:MULTISPECIES: nucleotide sugar dehydrogenase [Pacificimonas]MBZ6378694.1 nucleotide sugar dehydrogenase [Pacificimonas aurantium]OWV34038.1 UDP-N-acetyl-D-galactosamine dehydrogenase [Pacificimonas flava]
MQLGANTKVTVIGLGYVGLPLAVALAKSFDTMGVDINPGRVRELAAGHDSTREVEDDALAASSLTVTADIEEAAGRDIYIVTVPTPVDKANQPDLGPVRGATRAVGGILKKGGPAPLIIYESTVFPGVTEEICGPLLEDVSGLKRGEDFFLGYSPERINPGDKVHTVDKITRVVAGENPDITAAMSELYRTVTSGGTFEAASIKAAEAAKVIENAQRDINIAFMNEIAQIFRKDGISVYDVLDAANTKWNFLKFSPGLVGGHCIGVDPYYLSYKAQQLGHLPRVVLAGRSINDGMGAFVADQVHDHLRRASRILVLGMTFKEHVPDLRNSKVVDVISRLDWLGHDVTVHDPLANAEEAEEEYGLTLDPDAMAADREYDALVLAVPHQAYLDLDEKTVTGLLKPGGLIADVKGVWRDRSFGDCARWQL